MFAQQHVMFSQQHVMFAQQHYVQILGQTSFSAEGDLSKSRLLSTSEQASKATETGDHHY